MNPFVCKYCGKNITRVTEERSDAASIDHEGFLTMEGEEGTYLLAYCNNKYCQQYSQRHFLKYLLTDDNLKKARDAYYMAKENGFRDGRPFKGFYEKGSCWRRVGE